jgi:hypothetical protein
MVTGITAKRMEGEHNCCRVEFCIAPEVGNEDLSNLSLDFHSFDFHNLDSLAYAPAAPYQIGTPSLPRKMKEHCAQFEGAIWRWLWFQNVRIRHVRPRFGICMTVCFFM